MKIMSFLKFYLILVALLFMGFSFYESGFVRKLLLIILLTFFSPTLFRLYLSRLGVKEGDLVLAITSGTGEGISIFQKLPARALGSGKKNDIIDVELGPARFEGKITSCGGIISPPEVRIFHSAGTGEIF